MGQYRHKGDAAEEGRAEPCVRRRGPFRAADRGRLGHHGVAGPPEDALAHGIDEDRADQHDRDQRVGERVSADVLPAVENLDAGDPRVVEHERRPQLREDPDEHDRAAGEESGMDERERDLPEPAKARAAEVLGGLLHRGIDVRQRGDGVQVDVGVEREGFDDSDAPELVRRKPVIGPPMRPQPQVHDQRVERAVLPEDLLDADRAHERRKDHRDEDRGIKETLQGIEVPVGDEGQGHRDQEGERGPGARQEEGIAQGLQVDRVGEERAEEREREAPVRVHEAPLQDLEDRPEEEDSEERGRGEEHYPGRGPGHGATGAPSIGRAGS